MFVYFNFLNYNESLFYTLIKVIIYHFIKMTQRANNKKKKKIFKLKYILNICLLQVLNYNESLFYTLIKSYNTSLD